MHTIPLLFLLLTFYGCIVIVAHQSWLCRLHWWRDPAGVAPAWGLPQCAAVIAFILAGQAACARLRAGGSDRGVLLLASLLLTLLAAGLALALMRRADAGYRRILGLQGERAWERLLLAAESYLGFFPVFVLTSLVNYGLAYAIGRALGRGLDLESPQYAVRQIMSPDLPAAVRLTLVAHAVTGAPLCEEILFRGLLYGALKRHLDWRWAAVVSALVFALAHADPSRLLPLMGLGLLLALLRERSGSLVPAMFAHGLHNAIMLGLLRLGT